NNSVLNATYTPSAAEITAGFVNLILTTTGNGTCNAVSDTMKITYTPKPVVSAGANQTVCANNPNITLNGSVTVASGGIWSGGLGTYNPNNTTLNAVYIPSAVEITQGYADLTLTSTGNGTCNSESDSVHFTITPAPVVMAGPDQIICVDDLHVNLNGYVAGVTTTGIWSSGGTGGTFTPNASTLNAVYNASSADSTAGSITLVLTSTGNGNCLPVSDTMIVNILPTGTANAGPDQTVCGNNANALMSGSIGGGATIGTWSSSGSGIFVPTNTNLNAVYVPSQVDTAIVSVTLTLTANSCNMIQDQMLLTITDAPYVNAGNDITVCVDNLDIPLNGHVSGASTTGQWTGGNGTYTPDANTLNAVYHANAADSIAGHITLVLTATNIGLCAPVSDTLEINILPAGIVNAGPDQTFCANNANVVLNG
ncbi:MAG: hypothetical protein COZ21_12845, partial [Bacteroidetes bacterium CG_4_10_14_3_um_filter_31_20]